MNLKLLAFTTLLTTIPLTSHSAAAKKPAAPPMSQAELRACVAIDHQLSNLTRQYNAEVKLHNAVVATRQQMRTVLDEIQVSLDAGDKSRVAEYNAKVDEYNLEAGKLVPHQDRMTQIAVEQNQASTEYNTKCANRTFRHEDMAVIKGIKKK